MGKKKGSVATLRIEAPKPRNPLHAIMATRKAGSHTKPDKVLRRDGKQELRRQFGSDPSGILRSRGHNDKGDSSSRPSLFARRFSWAPSPRLSA